MAEGTCAAALDDSELSRAVLRQAGMTRGLVLMLLGAVVLACGAPAPTPSPMSPANPSPTPTPTSPANLPTLTLPNHIAGIPGPNDSAVSLESHTPAGSVPIGVEQNFVLGHCGLISPIDVDGSMWDPVAGDDGNGGALTEDQIGDLINATLVVFVLVDNDTMLMATQYGGRVLLTRHDGPRDYFACM